MRSAPIRLLLMATCGLLLVAGLAVAAVSPAGNMGTPRTQASTTALPAGATTGSVLVAGGFDATGAPLATAERYDVATRTWSATGPMAVVRTQHRAVLLPTGGVLVVGGETIRNTYGRTPELYEPTRNTWTPGATMVTGRIGHTANVVTNAAGATEVVVTGGRTPTPATLNSVETYRPATNVWITTPSMKEGRTGHAAVTLPDGRLLVTGGINGNGGPVASTEIYNPAAPGWTDGPPMASPRAGHTLSVVDGTHVLATGGVATPGGPALATAESFDPTTNTWTPVATPMAVARTGHEATVVRPGWVVVTGGTNAGAPGGLDSAESWTPTNGWGGLDNLPGSSSIGGARMNHGAAAIPQSDEVLVVGGGLLPGNALGTVTASAARWTPDRPVTPTPTAPVSPPVIPVPTPLQAPPVPVQNRSIVAVPVSGDVFVRIGKTDEYRELETGEALPVGTVLDTSDGRVQLVSAIGRGQQSAWFWGGTFSINQPKGSAGYVEVRLFGRPTCKAPKTKTTAKRSAAQKKTKRKKRPRAWGDGKGKFRTKGVNSTASVRGTKWLVEERCSGTFTRVARGSVSVRDFTKRKTVIVRAPKSYLARPRAK
ncbi:MAG: hypothetical protein JHD16_06560 [Solirubrobacteraceae bacterium]|nr:hypothetical protein [Solirubrobacteraceae bacterium]